MNTTQRLFLLMVLGFAGDALVAGEPLVGTGFTYQGQLRQDGVPLSEPVDFEFRLFPLAVGGTQIGPTAVRPSQIVENGLFTTLLDFGETAFNGQTRFLQVAVRSPAGSGAYVTLTPRQAITATPYAIRTRGIAVDGAPSPNVGIGTFFPAAKLHVKGADEGIRIDGPASGAGNAAFVSFRDSSGTRIGFVGDGSGGDTNTFLASDSGDVILYTGAGPVLAAKSNGNVGIGTTTPNKKLTVDGDMEIGLHSADYHHLRIGGGNSEGFLYGSFPRFGDGIHMGYNYYADANGADQVIHSDGQTSRISMGYGYIGLSVGGTGTAPTFDRLWIDSVGYIHIAAIPFGDYHNVQWNSNDGRLFHDDSTRRHKENIKSLTADFERLLDAEPVTYTRPGMPDRWEIGFIAEDMHDLGLKELVSYDAEGQPNGYNYEKSTLYLVAIAKAQRTQLAEQATRLVACEEAMRALASRLEALERAAPPQ